MKRQAGTAIRGLQHPTAMSLAAVAGWLLVAAAAAQTVPVPPDPAPKAAPVTPAVANPSAAPSAEPAVAPPTVAESPRKAVDDPVQPILEADPKNPNVPRQPGETKPKPVLVREGRRLFDRPGTIVRVGNESLFISDVGESPMVLVACKALERTENLLDFGKKPLQFLVSGEVSEYRDRNYLLMTEAPRNAEAAAKSAEPPAATKNDASAQPSEPVSPPPVSPPPSATAPDGRDRSVPPPKASAVIPPPPPEPTVPPSRPKTAPASRPVGESGPMAGSPLLLPEDKRLIDREGRLVREGTTSIFVFDNGDTPVVLIPNLKLQRMEELSDYGRQPVRFRISGRITEYRGRNHLAMTKLVVIPKAVEDL